MIKVIIQCSPERALSAKDIADRYDAIMISKNDDDDMEINIKYKKPINRNTIRTYLHRMQKTGDVLNENRKWKVLKLYEIQKKTG